jgi:hypothetical protein
VVVQYWGEERDAGAAVAAPPQQPAADGGGGESPDGVACKGLVVLLPLTLGIGKVRSLAVVAVILEVVVMDPCV